jgi:hypothetical protein
MSYTNKHDKFFKGLCNFGIQNLPKALLLNSSRLLFNIIVVGSKHYNGHFRNKFVDYMVVAYSCHDHRFFRCYNQVLLILEYVSLEKQAKISGLTWI